MPDENPTHDPETDAEVALEAAIKGWKPTVDFVAFGDDGEHVYIGPVYQDGEKIVARYRLGADAQRFLMGEFPRGELPDDFSVLLKAPDGGED